MADKLTTKVKGEMGEGIACRFLIRQGFEIVERNYLKKWGELDIVARKNGEVHFFEIKSLLYVPSQMRPDPIYRPEENVHDQKIRRLRRIILTYIAEKGPDKDIAFCFHILCIFMNMKTRRARVKWLRNVIL